ncbi:MAG TPA: hypothetical protein VLB83_03685 [Candidatus Paceibacterota bacterium]|nr:hypothetical protein [Candidatus Paceibacterota bacterium]
MDIDAGVLLMNAGKFFLLIAGIGFFGFFLGRTHMALFQRMQDPHVKDDERAFVSIYLVRRAALILLVISLLIRALLLGDNYAYAVETAGQGYALLYVLSECVLCFVFPVGLCSGVDQTFVPPWRLFDWSYYVPPAHHA